MMQACRQYLTARLQELLLQDGVTAPFRPADPDTPGDLGTIFFEELPRDFLKDNDYAVCCLPLRDANKRHGKLIARSRTLGDEPQYTLTRRRFSREILFRCLLYGDAEALWGTEGFKGLADQFSQAIAECRVVADSGNSAIRVEPQDAARPWDSEVEKDRKLRRPRLAIVRVRFDGGIQTTRVQRIIPSVEIIPKIGG